jgi:hypothetical protein
MDLPLGERLSFSGGMIRWYFVHKGGVYQVNSQQYWKELPPEDLLQRLYRHDKKRLLFWLDQRERRTRAIERERKQQVQWALPPKKCGRPRLSAKEKRFSKKLQLKPNPPIPLRWLKPDGSKYYAAFPLSDHDYVEAMFWLYSQERSRLLA